MTKAEEIKQKAIDYGFDEKFVNSISVEFSEDGYGYDDEAIIEIDLYQK